MIRDIATIATPATTTQTKYARSIAFRYKAVILIPTAAAQAGPLPLKHIAPRFSDLGKAWRAGVDYFTSWMRLTMSAYLGPYLSHTGFTAAWKAFLSSAETWMISMPAALALSIAWLS